MLARHISLRWAGLALAFLAAAQALAGAFFTPALPPFRRPALQEFALTDAVFALGGFRRLGADLAFIQMLQYYATLKEGGLGMGEEHDAHHGHSHETDETTTEVYSSARSENFPLLKDHILRSTGLDPFFHYVYLFGAGALAFNLNRDDEALALLKAGAEADPSYWQFRLYAGAIGYRKSADLDKVVSLLEEAAQNPDCPSMLQNILANIHKKRGNLRRAAEIYIRMAENSRDEAYRGLALAKLEEIRRGLGLQP